MEDVTKSCIIVACLSILPLKVLLFFCALRKSQREHEERLARTRERVEHGQTLGAHIETLDLQEHERLAFNNFFRFMAMTIPPEYYPTEFHHSSSARREERIKLIEQSLYTTELNEGKEIANLANALKLTPQPQDEEKKSSHSDNSHSWTISVIESLRSNTDSSTNSICSCAQLDCSICLQAYENGEQIALAKTDKCNHVFHKECIQMWLIENDDCPLCRCQIIGGDDNNV